MLGAIFSAIMDALASIVLAVVRLVKVLYSIVVNWFKEREVMKMSDRDNLAFTIKEKLRNGEVGYVQGIFNQRTDEMLDARELHAQSADAQMMKNHDSQDLVIYE